jgi:uncharacterized cupredoxin-like copper-binding protein
MKFTQRFILGALVLGVAGLIAACGPSAPPTVEKTLETTEFAFAPAEFEVAAGSALAITLENKGTLEHDLTIDSISFKVEVAIGKTATGTTGELAAGTYDFHCSVPGHKEAGMVGVLTVK